MAAEGGGCRDERRGSSASEVGKDDGTAKKKKKKRKKKMHKPNHCNHCFSITAVQCHFMIVIQVNDDINNM